LVTNIQVFEDVLGANLLLDQIADADTALQKAQIEKAEAKAEEKQAKKTCICVWESPEMSVVNPACPVHGGDQPAAIS
jgi:hypothetical protein